MNVIILHERFKGRFIKVSFKDSLATIELAVEAKLLYFIGDPVEPNIIWKKL